ncbi:7668_t:CDS:1, partial [Racocetra persica]
ITLSTITSLLHFKLCLPQAQCLDRQFPYNNKLLNLRITTLIPAVCEKASWMALQDS